MGKVFDLLQSPYILVYPMLAYGVDALCGFAARKSDDWLVKITGTLSSFTAVCY